MTESGELTTFARSQSCLASNDKDMQGKTLFWYPCHVLDNTRKVFMLNYSGTFYFDRRKSFKIIGNTFVFSINIFLLVSTVAMEFY